MVRLLLDLNFLLFLQGVESEILFGSKFPDFFLIEVEGALLLLKLNFTGSLQGME